MLFLLHKVVLVWDKEGKGLVFDLLPLANILKLGPFTNHK
jgi:hypothetical protein